jgi:hypothetical protein
LNRVVERLRDYQRHAAECLLLADQVTDPVSKFKLLAMAQAWARLAELAEHYAHGDAVCEVPSPRRTSMH